eukprot:601994-Hanusia_phi.AAC.1
MQPAAQCSVCRISRSRTAEFVKLFVVQLSRGLFRKRLGTLATPGDGSGLTPRLETPSETVGADTGDLNLFRVGGIMASCGIQDSAGLRGSFQLVRIACKAVFNSGHNKAQ